MRRWLRIALLCAGVQAAACATPYGPMGVRGGYAETRLDARTFQVAVKGNGFTSRARVDEYLMLRSAELTLQSGFDCFYLLGQDAAARTRPMLASGPNGTLHYAGAYTKHETTATFWVLTAREAPAYPGAIDARATLAAFGRSGYR
jgi:hypothetical protein